MEQELVKHKDLELILEESNEEITQLKSFLHDEEIKKENLKGLNYIKPFYIRINF